MSGPTPVTDEWLGATPSGWRALRLGWVARLGNGSTPDRAAAEYWADGDGYPWLNSARINDGRIRKAEQFVTKKALAACHLPVVRPGSILVAITGEGQTRGRAALLEIEATISQHLAFLEPKSTIHAPFLWRQLEARYEWLRTESGGTGSTRAALTCEFLRSVRVAVPPPALQRRIAAFLDRKTAAIDDLIAKKQRLIELLQEKRQALITQAVTKGLDPSVPMKDSGVEWIGKIPGHWTMSRFKDVVRFQEGPGILAVDFREQGVPLLRISCVQSDPATLNGCGFLEPADVRRRWPSYRVDPGDLLISASASTDVVSEVGPEVAGSIPYTGIIRMKPKGGDLDKLFLKRWLTSMAFTIQVDQAKTGATIQHFGPKHLNSMRMPLPPVDEQRRIAEVITHQSNDILAVTDRVATQVAVIREYRQALITAAVTGKLDIPGAPEGDVDGQAQRMGV